MPQLDASSFPSQLFWLTVLFMALYVLLARVLLPRVQSVLAKRARTMENDVEQAERLKSEAARAVEQYEETLAKARSASQAMLSQAQAEIAARAAARQAELDASMEMKMANGEAAIRAAKQAVSGKLEPVAGDLASLIVEVMVHEKPSSADIGNAVSALSRERNL